MKMHIAAIGFNERELEMYVGQLRTQGFESLSEVKRADDGTFYQALARTARTESGPLQKAMVQPAVLATLDVPVA